MSGSAGTQHYPTPGRVSEGTHGVLGECKETLIDVVSEAGRAIEMDRRLS